MTARPNPHTFPSYTRPLSPTTSDLEQASDDDHDEDLNDLASDTQSLVGVSLGQAQSRLNSPAATVGEKTAVLNLQPSKDKESYEQDFAASNGDENGSYDGTDEPVPLPSSKPRLASLSTVKESQPVNDQNVFPSPWRAGPNSIWSIDGALDQPRSTRARGFTGQSSILGDDSGGWRRLLPSLTLPQLSKVSNFPHRLSLASLTGLNTPISKSQGQQNLPNQSPEDISPHRSSTLPQHDSSATSILHDRPLQVSPTRKTQFQTPQSISSSQHASPRPSLLRRTTSDGSLRYLQRSMSRASSLGDDERWADVHEQVNSRMKAIKDSLTDSKLSSKIPKLPEMPTLAFDGSWLDLQVLKKRAGSIPQFREPRRRSPDKRGLRARSSSNAEDAYVGTASNFRPPKATNAQYPQFTRALENLTGDVVILGGYRGSILRSAEPPHRQCWVPIKVGLNLRKVDLEVGLEADADELAEESIIADGMLKNIGPVDISRRLFKRLRSSKNALDGSMRVWDFGYDWRLSPHFLSAQLLNFLQDLPCNSKDAPAEERGATIIAHSLGGLITRHTVNVNPSLVAGVVYAGVPQTCVNILGPLRNGDDVLLSSKVLTAQVNFTIRTSFALLPLDGKCFVNRSTNEEYPVDFFDAQTWEELCLSPCVSRPRPPSQSEPRLSTVGSLVNSMSSVLPNMTRYRSTSSSTSKRGSSDGKTHQLKHQAEEAMQASSRIQTVNPQMDRRPATEELGENAETSPSTAVTLPKDAAMHYLERTLAEVKRFKEELVFRPEIGDKRLYPSAAVIYGKSTPTVYGANVASREHIKYTDAYDDLAFASGDGVVLARAAQLPEGYRVARGGVVSSDRGHVSLLGDLEAVGRCLNAIRIERKLKRQARLAMEARDS